MSPVRPELRTLVDADRQVSFGPLPDSCTAARSPITRSPRRLRVVRSDGDSSPRSSCSNGRVTPAMVP